MSKEDALKAIDCGVDAVMISNHGGRQLDGSRSPFDQIKEIKDSVEDKLELICDGGIRRGSDIIKYLSLGADIVGVGRPALYGLMANGKKGVENIFKILQEELFISMTNSGIKDIKSIKRQ